MKEAVGVIYTSKNEFSLRELSSRRSVSAIPVAARYRVVDFLLSNLVNSGVRKVGVLVQGNYHSLMDHLSTGKEWNLHTRHNGLFILPQLGLEDPQAPSGILDALKAVAIPTVEVHLSDVSEREEFRRHSFVSLYAAKTIMGKGFDGYREALSFFL